MPYTGSRIYAELARGRFRCLTLKVVAMLRTGENGNPAQSVAPALSAALEAAHGHDDLVIAAALAVLAWTSQTSAVTALLCTLALAERVDDLPVRSLREGFHGARPRHLEPDRRSSGSKRPGSVREVAFIFLLLKSSSSWRRPSPSWMW